MPLPLSPEDRETAIDAILDAQSDVDAYLGQPVLPQRRQQRGLWDTGDTWDLERNEDLPIVRVLSATPEYFLDEPTGTFTVTYLAGIDAREDEYRPIRRYIVAHAKNSVEFTAMWKRLTKVKGDIKTISAEGQSVTLTSPTLGASGGKPGDGSPGSLPAMTSMSRWRVAGRRVYQGPTHLGERYVL